MFERLTVKITEHHLNSTVSTRDGSASDCLLHFSAAGVKNHSRLSLNLQKQFSSCCWADNHFYISMFLHEKRDLMKISAHCVFYQTNRKAAHSLEAF